MAAGSARVFSVNDFKQGLDVRKSALTAPGGSLRILENAMLNEGGEIEKRFAFVNVTTLPPQTAYVFGSGGALHVFCFNIAPAIAQGSCPVPLVSHSLTNSDTPARVLSVEAFDGGFYVCVQGASGRTYCHWNGVIVNDVGSAAIRGSFARTYKTKMYRTDQGYLRFSGVNAPSVEDPANAPNPGAGFINLAINDPEAEAISAMEVYYDRMAVFARLMTQLWTLDPDPDSDSLTQVLRTGTIAPQSVLQFGTGDILFLSDSGIRSLKALNANMAAAVSDVGSAIDPLLIGLIRSDPAGAAAAIGVVQPIRGRYWLAIRDKIYVLSFFPAGSITAWSVLTPGFTPAEMTVAVNMVFVREAATQKLYLYGGTDMQTYDSCLVTVRTPHLAIESPTARKRIHAVDVMCTGAWAVNLGMIPNNTELFELVANIQDNTYGVQTIPFAGYGTHVAAHLTSQAAGPATLSALHLHIVEASLK